MTRPEVSFEQPWQAQVFAMTIALQDAGVIEAGGWAQALGSQVAASPRDDGADYYQCWTAALAGLLERKGLAGPGELHELTAAWHAAAARTPHGQPIHLVTE